MRQLLALRDGMSRFYGKHDTEIRILGKFLLALVTFLAINRRLGQMAALCHPLVVFGLALLCAFLPSNSIILLGACLVLVHFYAISLEAALAGGGMLVIGLLLYFSIAPHSAAPLLVSALTMGLGVPSAAAVLFGLIGGPLSSVGVIFGVAAYDVVMTTDQIGGSLEATASDAAEAIAEKMTALIDAVISDQEMLLIAGALALLLWIVLLIRQQAIRYAWMVGAIAGLDVYLLMRVLGGMLIRAKFRPVSLAVDCAAALLTAWIAQAFLFSLDYKRTENIRFEDDEYFYYVKAIPKRKVQRKKRPRRVERR